jgi:hypothetical protein
LQSTNTCRRLGSPDSNVDTGVPPDTGVRDDAPVDAPIVDSGADTAIPDGDTGIVPDAGGCFVDEFDDGVLAGFRVTNGTWVETGGEAQQTDANETLAYMYAAATEEMSDYVIRSRMRMLRDPNEGAMEVIFRVNPESPNEMYFCNWEPTSRRILIMRQTASVDTTVLDDHVVPMFMLPGYTPTMPVTMNIEVSGPSIHCWLDEIGPADLTVIDNRYSTGAVGFKTYAIATAYEDLSVCPL